MGKGPFWLGKWSDTDSRQDSKTHLTATKEENQYEVSESYMKHPGDESKGNNIDNNQGTQHLAVKEEDEDESRGSNMDSVPGIVRHVAVKTEEVGDPRIRKMYGPRIQMMYRGGWSEEREESTDSSEDSSSVSSSDDYEELIKEFPEITEVAEEERKGKERRRVEKQLRRRKYRGRYHIIWYGTEDGVRHSGGWGSEVRR